MREPEEPLGFRELAEEHITITDSSKELFRGTRHGKQAGRFSQICSGAHSDIHYDANSVRATGTGQATGTTDREWTNVGY